MNYKEICDLIKTVSESKLTSFQIEIDGMKIKMGKYEDPIEDYKNIDKDKTKDKSENEIEEKSHLKVNDINIPLEKHMENKKDKEDENRVTVKSPIVGTFYAAPAKDKEPFVKVGQKVKKGDTLCVIEAMKLMNNIEAEIDGEVVQILAKNEEMVEYNEPLFVIKK